MNKAVRRYCRFKSHKLLGTYIIITLSRNRPGEFKATKGILWLSEQVVMRSKSLIFFRTGDVRAERPTLG
jgi:hypothetical protein